jgi:hypothetical protein
MLPKGLGFGSGVMCWRRLRDWQKAGLWRRLHRVLLDGLVKAGLIDWSRASLDSASVSAKALTGAHVHDSKVFEDRAEGLKSCTPTKATITRAAGGSCENGAFRRG